VSSWIHGSSVASQSDCMRSILQHRPPTQLHLLKYVPFSFTGQKQLTQVFLTDLRIFLQSTHYGRSSKTREVCHRLCLAHQKGDLKTRR